MSAPRSAAVSGLRAPRGRNHRQRVGRCALGDVRHGKRFPADRLRQLHGPAHVSGRRNGGAAALGAEHQCAESMPKNHVYEGALEFNVPLLKDMPGFQDALDQPGWPLHQVFDLRRGRILEARTQLADHRFDAVPQHACRRTSARRTSTTCSSRRASRRPASTTGSRAAAPRACGWSRAATRYLTPEEAKTFTAGVVLTPSFIPRFSFAVDFYETKLTNAITNLNYAERRRPGLCLASAPPTIRRSATWRCARSPIRPIPTT